MLQKSQFEILLFKWNLQIGAHSCNKQKAKLARTDMVQKKQKENISISEGSNHTLPFIKGNNWAKNGQNGHTAAHIDQK